MISLQFVSDDRRYGLWITQAEIDLMKSHCADWGLSETGGILVGHYNEDRNAAVIMKASLAPEDSRRGRTWFIRGVFRLQEWLWDLWVGHGEYYLGEWHYHPGGGCHPSATDARQMEEIARNKKYACPEPVLIIIAQPRPGVWEIGAYVCPKTVGLLELHPSRS